MCGALRGDTIGPIHLSLVYWHDRLYSPSVVHYFFPQLTIFAYFMPMELVL